MCNCPLQFKWGQYRTFMSNLYIRSTLLYLTSLFLCAASQASEKTKFDNTIPLGVNMEVIAFVGEKISFEEKNLPNTETVTLPDGTSVERVLPVWSTRYEGKYKVLSWASEDKMQDTIHFELYDHYSRPWMPKIPMPLIFLQNHKGRWVAKKTAYSLSATTDGDWAICGKPTYDKKATDQGERYVQPLAFIEPVKDLDGNICKSGTRAEDIFKFLHETRFLPNKWNVTCHLELGRQKHLLAGKGPNADAHGACVDRLKFEAGVY